MLSFRQTITEGLKKVFGENYKPITEQDNADGYDPMEPYQELNNDKSNLFIRAPMGHGKT